MEPDTPPGWDYNPATIPQRLPIIALALLGAGIAGYLSLYQFRLIESAWDPIFGDQTERILDSELSYVLPIPDAALGAIGFLADAVAAVIGGRRRWKTMPWLVVLFGILVGPLGVVSLLLVMAQPLLYDSWCTLCLVTALISALMVGPAMDEVLASLQEVRRVMRRENKGLWRALLAR